MFPKPCAPAQLFCHFNSLWPQMFIVTLPSWGAAWFADFLRWTNATYNKISFGNIAISGKLTKTGQDVLVHVGKREATGIYGHDSRAAVLYVGYLVQSLAHWWCVAPAIFNRKCKMTYRWCTSCFLVPGAATNGYWLLRFHRSCWTLKQVEAMATGLQKQSHWMSCNWYANPHTQSSAHQF